MEQSKTLGQFYQDYYNWATTDVPSTCFNSECGLCNNLVNWSSAKEKKPWHSYTLYQELVQQLREAGLDQTYPFSSGHEYHHASEARTQHLNPRRLQWVRDHLPKG